MAVPDPSFLATQGYSSLDISTLQFPGLIGNIPSPSDIKLTGSVGSYTATALPYLTFQIVSQSAAGVIVRALTNSTSSPTVRVVVNGTSVLSVQAGDSVTYPRSQYGEFINIFLYDSALFRPGIIPGFGYVHPVSVDLGP